MIAPRRRIGSRIAPASSGSRRSPRCGGCGSPARRSPRRWGWRSRPSRGSSRGSGWASSAASASSPRVRYERERPGELIHIDVKKLGRIERGAGSPDHRQANREAARAERTLSAYRARSPAGSTSTSRSMTAPAWPTPRSSPTRERSPSSVSSAAPSRSTPATASP